MTKRSVAEARKNVRAMRRAMRYDPIKAVADSSYAELMGDMGDSVLDKAKKLVDGREKQEHYGPPAEFMGRLAKMWSGYLGSRLSADLTPADSAMMMALLKAARLSTDPHHEDSLQDFAGYAYIYESVK